MYEVMNYHTSDNGPLLMETFTSKKAARAFVRTWTASWKELDEPLQRRTVTRTADRVDVCNWSFNHLGEQVDYYAFAVYVQEAQPEPEPEPAALKLFVVWPTDRRSWEGKAQVLVLAYDFDTARQLASSEAYDHDYEWTELCCQEVKHDMTMQGVVYMDSSCTV